MKRKIPVGYRDVVAMDLVVGDVIHIHGEVLGVKIEYNCLIHDGDGDMYFGDGIVVSCPSLVDGFIVDTVFGFYEPVRVVVYEEVKC